MRLLKPSLFGALGAAALLATGCATPRSNVDNVKLAIPGDVDPPQPGGPPLPQFEMGMTVPGGSQVSDDAKAAKAATKAAKKKARSDAREAARQNREEARRERAADSKLQLERVHFAYGSALIDPPTQRRLGAVAKELAANPEVRILLVGHADRFGDEEANDSLATMRAYNVRKVLLAYGAPPNHVFRTSAGEDRPLVTATGAVAAAANRRVEFRVLDGDELADGSSDEGVDWDEVRFESGKYVNAEAPGADEVPVPE